MSFVVANNNIGIDINIGTNTLDNSNSNSNSNSNHGPDTSVSTSINNIDNPSINSYEYFDLFDRIDNHESFLKKQEILYHNTAGFIPRDSCVYCGRLGYCSSCHGDDDYDEPDKPDECVSCGNTDFRYNVKSNLYQCRVCNKRKE